MPSRPVQDPHTVQLLLIWCLLPQLLHLDQSEQPVYSITACSTVAAYDNMSMHWAM